MNGMKLRVAFCALLAGLGIGLTGCDKIQEVVDKQTKTETPATALAAQESAPVAEAAPVQQETPPAPAPRTPEQILAEFAALASHEITDEKLAEVVDQGVGLEGIKTLDLTRSPVSNAGMASVLKLTALEVLNISFTRIDNAGLQNIADLKNLKMLVVDNTSIDKPGFEAIAKATSLIELHARSIPATDNIFEHIAELANLRVLHLDGNRNMQGKPFAELVKRNKFRELRILTAGASEFGYYGFETIGNLKGLEVLRAAGCKLADGSIAQIDGCVNLKFLELNENPLTNASMQSFAKLRKLETLDLGATGISDGGLPFIKALKGLKRLNLDGTNCTEAGVRELKTKFLKETEIRFAGQVL